MEPYQTGGAVINIADLEKGSTFLPSPYKFKLELKIF